MKKQDIKVGGVYEAKVNGVLVSCRVDKIDESPAYGYRARQTRYHVTSLKTGRTTTFRSAAKFRREVVAPATKAEEIVTNTYSRPGESKDQTVARAVEGLGARLAATQVETDTSPHLIVEARAGTGKTTTLVEGLKRVMGLDSTLTPSPQQAMVWDCMELSRGKAKSVCFVAFNRSIANELKGRVPAGCDAMTNHGLGLRAVRAAYRLTGGEGGVSEWRVRNIIGELVGQDIRDYQRANPVVVQATERLVSLCKMNLVGYGDLSNVIDGNAQVEWDEALDRLASHYEIELNGSRDKVFALVPRVLERCKQVDKDGCVDYDDMVWLPVVLSLPVRKYDLLLVDEAQDLNRCQQALAKMAGRRLVLCGDPRQAIYGFAGADAESMKRMEQELGATGRGCVRLPLTVTRRCGKAIVEEAKRIVPDFEAFETNGEGKVGRKRFDAAETDPNTGGGPETYHSHCQDGDMVLCRVNAPLVSQCFRFIKAGHKANIQGRDVAKGLVATVNKLKAATVVEFISKLGGWLDGEHRKEQAKRFPSEARLIALQDRHDCLMCFTEGLVEDQSPDAVVRKIESIFTDDKNARGIRLSSGHKAKGLEANRVFILMPEGAECPHPMAKSPWQREQEMNLLYVMITRAREELVWVK